MPLVFFTDLGVLLIFSDLGAELFLFAFLTEVSRVEANIPLKGRSRDAGCEHQVFWGSPLLHINSS